ncbi:hypothetical protein CRENBAI_006619 [Crenichthys baileyi]|uniref:Uncharacterized protein n=1 Tax=Crenichthys baileyi TaxID=28760 RepID=A0AAV9QQA7_9TELE
MTQVKVTSATATVTLFEFFQHAAEKCSHQAAEKKKQQRSPFWGSRLAVPLPGTGPLRYRPSPIPHTPPPTSEPTSSTSLEPEIGAARFLCPVRDSSSPPLHSPGFAPAPSPRDEAVAEMLLSRFLRVVPTPPLLSRRWKHKVHPASSVLPGVAEHIYSSTQSCPVTPSYAQLHRDFVQSIDLPLCALDHLDEQLKMALSTSSAPLSVSALSEESVEVPASVSAGVQPDAPALVFAGGHLNTQAPVAAGVCPDVREPVSSSPDHPGRPGSGSSWRLTRPLRNSSIAIFCYWRTQLSRLIFWGFYGASFLRFSAFHPKPLLEFSRTLQPQFNLSQSPGSESGLREDRPPAKFLCFEKGPRMDRFSSKFLGSRSGPRIDRL